MAVPPSQGGKIPISNKTEDQTRSIPSISLKNLAKKAQSPSGYDRPVTPKVEVLEPVNPNWNEPFSQEKLTKSWQAYCNLIKHENPRLHSILTNHEPQLLERSVLLLKLKNKTQETEILNEKSRFFSFLKKELKNAQLELRVEFVIEEENGPQKAYTSADKLKLMFEKNPSLLKLKQQFGLDLE